MNTVLFLDFCYPLKCLYIDEGEQHTICAVDFLTLIFLFLFFFSQGDPQLEYLFIYYN